MLNCVEIDIELNFLSFVMFSIQKITLLCFAMLNYSYEDNLIELLGFSLLVSLQKCLIFEIDRLHVNLSSGSGHHMGRCVDRVNDDMNHDASA